MLKNITIFFKKIQNIAIDFLECCDDLKKYKCRFVSKHLPFKQEKLQEHINAYHSWNIIILQVIFSTFSFWVQNGLGWLKMTETGDEFSFKKVVPSILKSKLKGPPLLKGAKGENWTRLNICIQKTPEKKGPKNFGKTSKCETMFKLWSLFRKYVCKSRTVFRCNWQTSSKPFYSLPNFIRWWLYNGCNK